MERARKLIEETAYQYDYSSRVWGAAAARYATLPAKADAKQSHHAPASALAHPCASDVPVVLLGEFGVGEWDYQCFHAHCRQRMVWCSEHKRFEKVHHIERMDSIRSVDSCREHGMVAHFSFSTEIQVSYCLGAKSHPTLFDPMVCSLPGSSVHELLQARILE